MSGKPRQRLSQKDRRAQLTNGAVVVAARVGLGRMAHAAVAKECGVSVPTAFSYFENRAALVSAVVEEVKRFYLEQGARWHRPDVAPHAAVEGHVKAYASSVANHPQYAQIWLEWSTAVRNEDGIWDSFLDYQDRIVAMIASSIRRGQKQGGILNSINATDAARLIVATATTITQLHFMRRNKRVINKFIDQSVHLALSGSPSPVTGEDP